MLVVHKVAAGAATAAASPVLQTGAHLSMPSSESGAHDRCCPGSFLLDRQVSMLFELMRKIGGPPRYLPEFVRLRAGSFDLQSLQAENGPPVWCRPIVCGLSSRRSTVELQEEKWWPARDVRSARSIKSRLLRYQSLQAIGIRSRICTDSHQIENLTAHYVAFADVGTPGRTRID